MDFIIRKDVYGSWWHDFNNNSTKVNISDFECVIDAVANTFIIQCKNGSNLPSQAESITNIKVIDQNVSETPISFSGAVGLKNLLTSKGYTPFLVPTTPSDAVLSVNGQTGVVIINLDYLPLAGGTMDVGADIFFDNGSKISEGVVDAGTGGNKGIALTCAVGYEWKWEAGEAYLTNLNYNYIDVKQYARGIPLPTDDTTKGFVSGSNWYTLEGKQYVCADATIGAAVWEQVINTPNLTQVVTQGDISVWFQPIDIDTLFTIPIDWQVSQAYVYGEPTIGTGGIFLDKTTIFSDYATLRFCWGYQSDAFDSKSAEPFEFTTDAKVYYNGDLITSLTIQPTDLVMLKSGGIVDGENLWILTITNKSSGVSNKKEYYAILSYDAFNPTVPIVDEQKNEFGDITVSFDDVEGIITLNSSSLFVKTNVIIQNILIPNGDALETCYISNQLDSQIKISFLTNSLTGNPNWFISGITPFKIKLEKYITP